MLANIFDINRSSKTPIWLMRQAGRYLPEYLEVKAKAGKFFDLCYNPELASEVTLQPIRRFGFDAAIVFSDILVIANSLGLYVDFKENEGPIVENISSIGDLSKINIGDSWQLHKTYETIKLVREKLDSTKSLIGFAGGPWTVATYIISRERNNPDYYRSVFYNNSLFLDKLIKIIKDQTIEYLLGQIEAGADVIQIFESHASLVPVEFFKKYIVDVTKDIVVSIKRKFPNVKIIGFPRGAGFMYKEYIESGIDVLAIDYMVPLEYAVELQKDIPIQGNLDPVLLLSDWSIIEPRVEKIMKMLSGGKFIFNLGHGIIKESKIENVLKLVDFVKGYNI